MITNITGPENAQLSFEGSENKMRVSISRHHEKPHATLILSRADVQMVIAILKTWLER